MTNHDSDLPVFPTSAPAVFCDPDLLRPLFAGVLDRLGAVIDVPEDTLDAPTPCQGFNVAELRSHTLGWLDFFAAALCDPSAKAARPDPDQFDLGDRQASHLVADAASRIDAAISDDAAGQLVTMQSSRMSGDGVLAMALGEYMIHAWDLATATGRTYRAPGAAVGPAHEFLTGMVAPEYRGPDTGFFDAEVVVPADASPFDRLLGFAGRDPEWSVA